MRRGIDSAAYEVLAAAYEKASSEVKNQDVGAYRTRRVEAGEFLYVSCYPLITAPANRRQRETMRVMLRQEKRKEMLRRMDKYNNKRRILYYEQLAQANFGKGDFHVTLTYEVQDWNLTREPEYRTREEAKRDLSHWLRNIKLMLKRRGVDVSNFRYLKVTVTKEGNHEGIGDRPDTHHHHVLLGGVPEEYRTEIERMWQFGFCNADFLQPNGKGIAEVSAYIARQEGSANGTHTVAREKSISGSRNLKKPKVTTSDTKISRRRVAKIAEDVRVAGIEIFESIYPDYRVIELPEVAISDFTAGAYIRVKLRRKYPRGAKKTNDGTGISGGGKSSDATHRSQRGTDRAASGAGGTNHAGVRNTVGRRQGIPGQPCGNGGADCGSGKRAKR